ncbi:hypothetical protein [Arthrobacter silvisoli]|uniref:hypothetical protein n=1 Tax=Arthrobacter silvisoli TaxID=2291022 RepID=UPI00144489FA|nr:hypothetical protein [Arthrobacter silvisoli]
MDANHYLVDRSDGSFDPGFIGILSKGMGPTAAVAQIGQGGPAERSRRLSSGP